MHTETLLELLLIAYTNELHHIGLMTVYSVLIVEVLTISMLIAYYNMYT